MDCTQWYNSANPECVAAAIKAIANTPTTLIDAGIKSSLGPVGESFMAGWQDLQFAFLTSWLYTPQLVDVTNPNGSVAWMQGLLANIAVLLAIAGAMISALWTLIALRGDRAKQLGISLVRMLIINSAGTAIFASLATAMQTASTWMLGEVGLTASSTLYEATLATIQPGIYIILGVLGILGTIVQWGVMLFRGAVVPLLLAVWPLAAAATALGEKASEAFGRITAWLAAFLLYPFAASIVYAFAYKQKAGADGIGGAVNGMILIVIAILALPALFRIIAPSTQALGKAYGGAIALRGAIQAAETAVAVGAVVLTAGAAGGAAGAAAARGGAAQTSTRATGGAPATGAATPAATPAAPGGARQSAPTQPAPEPIAAPAGAGDAQRSSRALAAQQAAQHLGSAAGATARGAVQDLDEAIGGN
ncbi:hypothetical protein [Plantibacter sp. CFBP 8775]|uniref:hypothetical protein n=1 Tax=Plantibacter sp. CFBP 8775 TaxID=2774038 RepID=UPI0017809F93|nr:hypothetical protein [Plantibacter sp. CFBP 8775]MBD8104762.1 hypothetical protein [Plantibacter sp. CFBP 8775]